MRLLWGFLFILLSVGIYNTGKIPGNEHTHATLYLHKHKNPVALVFFILGAYYTVGAFKKK